MCKSFHIFRLRSELLIQELFRFLSGHGWYDWIIMHWFIFNKAGNNEDLSNKNEQIDRYGI